MPSAGAVVRRLFVAVLPFFVTALLAGASLAQTDDETGPDPVEQALSRATPEARADAFAEVRGDLPIFLASRLEARLERGEGSQALIDFYKKETTTLLKATNEVARLAVAFFGDHGVDTEKTCDELQPLFEKWTDRQVPVQVLADTWLAAKSLLRSTLAVAWLERHPDATLEEMGEAELFDTFSREQLRRLKTVGEAQTKMRELVDLAFNEGLLAAGVEIEGRSVKRGRVKVEMQKRRVDLRAFSDAHPELLDFQKLEDLVRRVQRLGYDYGKAQVQVNRILEASWNLGWTNFGMAGADPQPEVYELTEEKGEAWDELRAILDDKPDLVDVDEVREKSLDVLHEARKARNDWIAEHREEEPYYVRLARPLVHYTEAAINITIGNVAYYGGGAIGFVLGKGWSWSQAGVAVIEANRQFMNEHLGGSYLGSDREFAQGDWKTDALYSLPPTHAVRFAMRLGEGIGYGLEAVPRAYEWYQKKVTGYSDAQYDRMVERSALLKAGWVSMYVAEAAGGLALMLSTGSPAGLSGQATFAMKSVGIAGGLSAAGSLGQEVYISAEPGERFDVSRFLKNTGRSTAGSLLFMGGVARISRLVAGVGAAELGPMRAAVTAKSIDVLEGLGDAPVTWAMMKHATHAQQMAGALLLAGVNVVDTFDVSLTGVLKNMSKRIRTQAVGREATKNIGRARGAFEDPRFDTSDLLSVLDAYQASRSELTRHPVFALDAALKDLAPLAPANWTETTEARFDQATEVLGHEPTTADWLVIELAHNIGRGEAGADGGPAGTGNYTRVQILRKARVLLSHFNKETTRGLLERGVAGEAAADLRANLNLLEENYEATNIIGLEATDSLTEFSPETRIEVTERDGEGNAVKGRIRVLVDNPGSEVYVLSKFNDWGESLSESDRLTPVEGSPYYEGEVRVDHGMQYRFQVDGKQLIDPAAELYNTRGYAAREGREEAPAYLNSVFWDFARPAAYQAHTEPVDLRTDPVAIAESEIHALVENWRRADGGVGPPSKGETYKFIAESGVIEKLGEMGYNAIEFLPFNASVDGDSWHLRYQVYSGFAIDSRYGTPDDFAKMIDAFNENGIAVVMDAVAGHYPFEGGDGVRDIADAGIHNWRKGDGSSLYGDNTSPWGTHRYDYANPHVRRFLIDGILTMMKRYPIAGIRFDNLDGIRSEPGGEQFMRDLVSALRRYRPESLLIGEMFFGDPTVTRSRDEGGMGINMRTHSDLFDFFKDYMRGSTQDINMSTLRKAIRGPWEWDEASRVQYMTNHDEAANSRDGATGAYPASLLDGGGEYYTQRKIIAFSSLAMLSGSNYLDLPQMRLLQKGSFYDNPGIEWGLAENEGSRQVFDYFTALTNAYTENPAFAFLNYHGNIENHVDYDNKIISFERKDFATGKKTYVVVNLSHLGMTDYRFGIDAEGEFKIALDSSREEFGGGGELADMAPEGILHSQPQGLHGRAHSLNLPFLAPYGVTVLEEQ